MTILIVEDEVIAASYLSHILNEEGFEVLGIVETGQEAIQFSRKYKPDLILMDIMLKKSMSGIDAAIEIQRETSDINIIFLTAYSDSAMIESAIQANAYGYFLKPYNKDEILANLKILEAKKTSSTKKSTDICLVQGYTYNIQYKQMYLHQKEVYLSKRELDCIELLCRKKHHVLTFDEIIQHIWGDKMPLSTLRSLIRRIRKKTTLNLIINVNKMGYTIGLQSRET